MGANGASGRRRTLAGLAVALEVLLWAGAPVLAVYAGLSWRDVSSQPIAPGAVLLAVVIALAYAAWGLLRVTGHTPIADAVLEDPTLFGLCLFAIGAGAALLPAGVRQMLADVGGSTAASGGAVLLLVLYLLAAVWLLLIGHALSWEAPEWKDAARTAKRGQEVEATFESRVAAEVRAYQGRVGARVRSAVPALPALALVAAVVWLARPLFHDVAMVFHVYPLLTWVPPALAGAIVLLGAGVGHVSGRGAAAGGQKVFAGAVALAAAFWCVCFAMLPSWQGRALYEATSYREGAALPVTTQPRLLPKAAAEDYGDRDDMRHAHLVVAPDTGELVWSGERKGGLVPRGASSELGVQPLDRIDGTLQRIPAGFRPAVSRVGPGSIKWRAAKRHYFTRLEDPIIVPLHGRRAVALVPYVGYRGFPVRRPYWQGVYVYHQDGRLEDLTPQQAMARPELARSGRLVPERLVRDVAEAHGYRSGALAPWLARDRTVVSDPEGNRQPYLTNLGDRNVCWITVAHRDGDETTLGAVFLTDAATGRTTIWRPPAQGRLLSTQGAAELARALPLESRLADWEYLRVSEPRPVFARRRLYYLVSIVPTEHYEPLDAVDFTVLLDAAERRITEVFDHADSAADDRLRAFFRRGGRGAEL